jgi:hypothetical protein
MSVSGNRPKPKALARTPAQAAAAAKRAEDQRKANDLAEAKKKADQKAQMLAQIVNLQIGGYSLEQIGAAIGATADEVDRMINEETARYVRNQPSLRRWVRDYVSGKYKEIIDTDWKIATDAKHPEHLDHQNVAIKALERLARLHGAEAPTQSEVKVEATPETIDAVVARLAASQGQGYDADVFDVEVLDEQQVHESATQALAQIESSAHEVEQPQEGDDDYPDL